MSIIIVGAGVFGLSTAMAASASLKVTLIDDLKTDSASRAVGRTFRTHYPRSEYTVLAEQARTLWQDKDVFHDVSRQVHENERIVSKSHDAGWIEAKRFMAELLEAAKRKVEFVNDSAVSLIWDGHRCTGVATESGRAFRTDRILLALGGGLPAFLKSEKRPIDDICYPAICAWLHVQLDDEQYEQLKDTPIRTYPGKAEYVPPNGAKCLWINNPRTIRVPDISQIPKTQDEDSPYYNETHELFRWLLPDYHKSEILSFHYCVDLFTQSQNFIVGAIPDSEGLFLAGGGSFHSFKLFPVIGDEILKILRGEETEYSRTWSVDAHRSRLTIERPVYADVVPKRTFPDP